MYNYVTLPWHLLPVGSIPYILLRDSAPDYAMFDIVQFVPENATLLSTAAWCSGTRHSTDTNIATGGKAG